MLSPSIKSKNSIRFNNHFCFHCIEKAINHSHPLFFLTITETHTAIRYPNGGVRAMVRGDFIVRALMMCGAMHISSTH